MRLHADLARWKMTATKLLPKQQASLHCPRCILLNGRAAAMRREPHQAASGAIQGLYGMIRYCIDHRDHSIILEGIAGYPSS